MAALSARSSRRGRGIYNQMIFVDNLSIISPAEARFRSRDARPYAKGGEALIGERLLELRKDAGLTQDALAAILNINKHSISAYEREKSEPPDAIKVAIARYFGVSVDYLLGVTDDPGAHAAHCDVLCLPKGFPEQAKRSLRDYAAFLYGKYGQTER